MHAVWITYFGVTIYILVHQSIFQSGSTYFRAAKDISEQHIDDGMLFEFFMNFLVFFAFHAISNIKKNWCKKNSGGGVLNFFFRKTIFLISRFMLFSTLKKEPLGRWFLQIVDRDNEVPQY